MAEVTENEPRAAKPAGRAIAVGLELVELVRAVPRIVGATIIGVLVGGGLGTGLGVLLLLVTRWFGWGAAEGWLAWGLALLSVGVFAAGGCYVGGLRGCAGALARCIDDLDWVAKLWNQVRPHAQRYALAVRAGANRAQARSGALGELQHDTATPKAAGLAERAERYLASMIHSALTGGLLGALVGTIDTNEETDWEEIEAKGLQLAGEVIGDMVARMFHGPAVIAMAVTVLLAAVPHALMTWLVS